MGKKLPLRPTDRENADDKELMQIQYHSFIYQLHLQISEGKNYKQHSDWQPTYMKYHVLLWDIVWFSDEEGGSGARRQGVLTMTSPANSRDPRQLTSPLCVSVSSFIRGLKCYQLH